MVQNVFKLNSTIMNPEFVLYQVFMSPLTTKADRKQNDSEDILAGNIFDCKLPLRVYLSLIRTLRLTGKKKHFKKLWAHMRRHLEPADFSKEMLKELLETAIENDFPILMSSIVSECLELDIGLYKTTFKRFLRYIESVKDDSLGRASDRVVTHFLKQLKGYSHIDLHYELVRPIMIKALRLHSSDIVIEFFDNVRQELENQAEASDVSEEVRAKRQAHIKAYYQGVIADMLDHDSPGSAGVVHELMTKAQFEPEAEDHLLGMSLAVHERSMERFEQEFHQLSSLGPFDSDAVGRVLEMTLKLHAMDDDHNTSDIAVRMLEHVQEQAIVMTGPVYDAISRVLTDKQMFNQLEAMLDLTDMDTADPARSSLYYIKDNLIYCSDSNQREAIRKKLLQIERQFY